MGFWVGSRDSWDFGAVVRLIVPRITILLIWESFGNDKTKPFVAAILRSLYSADFRNARYVVHSCDHERWWCYVPECNTPVFNECNFLLLVSFHSKYREYRGRNQSSVVFVWFLKRWSLSKDPFVTFRDNAVWNYIFPIKWETYNFISVLHRLLTKYS